MNQITKNHIVKGFENDLDKIANQIKTLKEKRIETCYKLNKAKLISVND